VTALTALLSFAAGASLSWLVLWARGAASAARHKAEADAAALVAAELAAERVQKVEAAATVARLAAELAAEKASGAARLADHEALANKFNALSSDALRANNTEFLKLAEKNFDELRAKSTGDLDTRKQAIESLVKPLKDSLEKVERTVGELEKKREHAYGALDKQLESLTSAHQLIRTETTKLSSALSSTRTAGTWGELQLRRVIELAGMIEHCDFEEQPTHSGESGQGRPDVVVSLAGGQHIAIDAKAPTEAFREAAAETNEEARRAKLLEHAAKVRGHVDALSQREYWSKIQPSPDYVVLFLPGDSFLAAAIESDPAVMDRAINKKVLLATPMTLIDLLKAAAYGWEQEKFSRNAEEVKKAGRELFDRVATFADHFENAGRSLAGAVKHFNAAVGSFEQNLAPGARKLAELGSKGAKELGTVAPVDIEARPVLPRKG
jgi:DNA recombination protein RmuC